jgi:hypothetical protein
VRAHEEAAPLAGAAGVPIECGSHCSEPSAVPARQTRTLNCRSDGGAHRGSNDMASFNSIGRLGFGNFVAIAALLVSVAGRPAAAFVLPATGFVVDIAPSARVLDALEMKRDATITPSEYYEIKYDEACDNPHNRIFARNNPALMITNGTSAPSDLATYTLTINEGAYAFGTGDSGGSGFTDYVRNTLYTDPGVSILGSSVSADKKTLTVNLSGLSAGKSVIFHIDLDSTDVNAFQYPDYRMVLFGAPVDNGDPTTDPATTTGTYANGNTFPTLSFSQAIDAYDDPVDFTDTPEYANAHIRPYQMMDPIEVSTLAVPEPTALALAFVGLGAMIARLRRTR